MSMVVKATQTPRTFGFTSVYRFSGDIKGSEVPIVDIVVQVRNNLLQQEETKRAVRTKLQGLNGSGTPPIFPFFPFVASLRFEVSLKPLNDAPSLPFSKKLLPSLLVGVNMLIPEL